MQVAWGRQLLRKVNCALSWRKPFLQHVRSEPNSAPVRSSSGSERAKAFCKSSLSLPLCMFDSEQSSPELPTIKLYFTIYFYYRHRHAKWSAKLCAVRYCRDLQSAFISAGGSLSSAGAQPKRVMDSKHSAARLKGEKRRGEEKRREEKRREEDLETSLASESVLKWPLTWTRFRCCRRNAACGANIYHKTMQMCPLPTQKKTQKYLSQKSNRGGRERERERESRYQQDSAEERQSELITFLDCSHFMTAWLHPIEIFHPDV